MACQLHIEGRPKVIQIEDVHHFGERHEHRYGADKPRNIIRASEIQTHDNRFQACSTHITLHSELQHIRKLCPHNEVMLQVPCLVHCRILLKHHHSSVLPINLKDCERVVH